MMRLTAEQHAQITNRIHECFGPQARVWLFGSRVYDDKKGGDIDLYVESADPELMSEIRCKVRLEEDLDLPVDLVVHRAGEEAPIYRIAKRQGVLL